MSKVFIIICFTFYSIYSYGSDVDDFHLLLKKALYNYKAVLESTSQDMRRDYVRVLNQLDAKAALIDKHLEKYKKYEEIAFMKFSELAHDVVGCYNRAKSQPELAILYANEPILSMTASNSLRSTQRNERSRLGAGFLLNKWCVLLKSYQYPNIVIKHESDIIRYPKLIRDFKLSMVVLNQETILSRRSKIHMKLNLVSPDVKRDVKRGFDELEKLLRKYQNYGKQKGLDLQVLTKRIYSYISYTSMVRYALGGSSSRLPKEVMSDYQKAFIQLQDFYRILIMPRQKDQHKVEKTQIKNQMKKNDHTALIDQLIQYRTEVIQGGDKGARMPYDKRTEKLFIMTLTKKEHDEYRFREKRFRLKGYSSYKARRETIKFMHAKLKSKDAIITRKELDKIFTKCGLTPDEFSNKSKAGKSDNDDKDQILKTVRLYIMGKKFSVFKPALDEDRVSDYERTLSKKEKVLYESLVKKEIAHGYEENVARSSGIMYIHGQYISRGTTTNSDELTKILRKCRKLIKKAKNDKKKFPLRRRK